MTLECMNEWVSDTCAFSRGSSLLGCFVQLRCDGFYFFLIIFLLLYSLLSLRKPFFSNKRQEGSSSGWEGRLGGTRKSRRRGKCNQDLLYEKKSNFNEGEFFSKLRCV